MEKFELKVFLFCALALLFGRAPVALGIDVTNDDCANAMPVGDVTNLAFDTSDATFDGPGHYMDSPNIWYCYTATCSGIATIDLCGSGYDTKLAVYKGCSCNPSSNDLIRANDDYCESSSQVSFGVIAGNQYLIEVGGYKQDAGQGIMTITCEPATCPPANDDCYNAELVGEVWQLQFDTRCATFDGDGLCITSPNIWYLYTASCTGIATVSLCGSDYDTILAAYDEYNCPPKLSDLIDCNDDYCDFASQLSFEVNAGNQYLIDIGGYGNQIGRGVLTITCQGQQTPSQPQADDDCSKAKPIGEVSNLAFDTTNTTFDGPGLCINSPNIWYCYTASCTGPTTVSLCGSSYDTKLAIYEGFQCYPTAPKVIGCNDDYCNLQSEITFYATAGDQYLIEIGGYQQATGQGVLSISCEGQPSDQKLTNDNSSSAKPVGEVTNMAFDTTNATADGPGICVTSPNIWFCYTASCTGSATVSLCGSSYDTKLAVYDGCQSNPTADKLRGCNDDYCNTQSEITLDATAGSQYLIEVGGYQQATGQGVLSISCEGQPSDQKLTNDNSSSAKPVGEVTNMAFDTTNATADGPGICMTSPNIWFCYTASCTGSATVSLCGSSYDTKLAVYDGCQSNPTADKLRGCNDDYCNTQSEITLDATAGSQYLIEVGGYQQATGQGVLSISCEGGQAPAELDFADAPDSTNNFGRVMTAYNLKTGGTVQANFPTIFNDGRLGPYGPFHRRPRELAYLGNNVSQEAEADIGADQDGINNIDPPSNSANKDGYDDGVILPLSLPNCGWAGFDYIVNVINPGTDLWINVWFDWNRDGDWDDDSITNTALSCSKGFVSEWAVQNQYLFDLPAGLNQIATPGFLSYHPQGGPEKIWMRITLSEQPWTGGENPDKQGNGGSGPQSGYTYGETEDYFFTPIVPEAECSMCQDLNGDGRINYQDLSILVQQWIAQCM